MVQLAGVERKARRGRVDPARQRRVVKPVAIARAAGELAAASVVFWLCAGGRPDPDQRLPAGVRPGGIEPRDQLLGERCELLVVPGQLQCLDQRLIDVDGQHRLGLRTLLPAPGVRLPASPQRCAARPDGAPGARPQQQAVPAPAGRPSRATRRSARTRRRAGRVGVPRSPPRRARTGWPDRAEAGRR